MLPGENLMFATMLAAVLALVGFVLLVASAFLGSAVFGISNLADWTVDAAQAFLWLAMLVYLGYFLAASVTEIRNMR
jgi:ABC-type transport system involved in cytochrome c biogenesis permease subunit